VADLVHEALRFRALLLEEGWAPPVVPLLAARTSDCLAAMLGTVLAGKAFACLNLRLRPAQVESILARSGLPRLVCDAHGRRALEREPERSAAQRPLMLDVDRRTPRRSAGALAAELAALAAELDERRAACCLFTSGSTGEPKGVLISGADLSRRARAEVECYELGPTDRLLNLLPFAFDVGLNQALTSLLAGAQLILLESWLPKDLLHAAARFGVTGISGVPAVWRDLCRSGLRFDRDGAHHTLRYITVSGGSLAPSELSSLKEAAAGIGIFKTYGQTESFRSTMLFPADLDRKIGSVGQAFRGTRPRVVDEHGRSCGPYEVGEVVHSGIGVMLGYLGGPDIDGKRRHNTFGLDEHDSEFVIWTGDLGYMDDEGFLFLKGRRDGMLKVAGNRFYPDEIASALLALPGVSDAEVIGAVSDAVENVVAAFVVADGSAWTTDSMQRALRDRLPSYMVPSSVVMLPSMPRLPNGKPDRVRLRQLASQPADERSPGAVWQSTDKS
jgi:acyl-CoA synthetase (AMP-forming)/AMP-acid ligase II